MVGYNAFIAALLWCLGGLAVELSAADDLALDIRHDAHAPIEKDLQPARLAFEQKSLSGVWQGKQPEPAMEQTLAALRLMERNWSGEAVEPETVAAVAAALAAGSHDPVVQFLDARLRNDLDLQQQLSRYRASYRAFTGSPYPAFLKSSCSVRIVTCLRSEPLVDATEVRDAIVQAESDLVESLASLPMDDAGAERPVVINAQELLEHQDVLAIPDMSDRLLADLSGTKIPPWWSDYLRGMVQVQLAWKSRGSGFADTITPQGQHGMDAHLAQARHFLVAAWKRHPDRPEPASEMITVAMAGDTADGDEEVWFEHAVAARMDYLRAYDDFLQACTPRWGGSYAKMLNIGTAAADTQRFDTEVPWRLIAAVHAIWNDAADLNAPRPGILDRRIYDRCQAVVDAYGAQQRTPANANAPAMAVIAWMCNLPGETLRQLDAAGDHPNTREFKVAGTNASGLRSWANSETHRLDPKSSDNHHADQIYSLTPSL